MMKWTQIALSAAALMTGLSGTALAQFAPGGGGGDTELYADDVVSAGGVTTLTGQVDARQGETRILSDRMVIYSNNQAGGAAAIGAAGQGIDRIVATGNFFYITPEQEVRGDKGIYTRETDSFTVTGDVVLVQDESVVRGNKLIYELSSQKARVVSDCKGRRCGRKGRVAILIKSNGNTQTSGQTS